MRERWTSTKHRYLQYSSSNINKNSSWNFFFFTPSAAVWPFMASSSHAYSSELSWFSHPSATDWPLVMLKPRLLLTKLNESKIWPVPFCLYLYSLLVFFSLPPTRRQYQPQVARAVEETTPLQPFGNFYWKFANGSRVTLVFQSVFLKYLTVLNNQYCKLECRWITRSRILNLPQPLFDPHTSRFFWGILKSMQNRESPSK